MVSFYSEQWTQKSDLYTVKQFCLLPLLNYSLARTSILCHASIFIGQACVSTVLADMHPMHILGNLNQMYSHVAVLLCS